MRESAGTPFSYKVPEAAIFLFIIFFLILAVFRAKFPKIW